MTLKPTKGADFGELTAAAPETNWTDYDAFRAGGRGGYNADRV